MKRTGLEWAEYFGIEILNENGWHIVGKTLKDKTTVTEFVDMFYSSTVYTINKEKYKNFLYIFG